LLSGVLAVTHSRQLEIAAADTAAPPLIRPAGDPVAKQFSELAAGPPRHGLALRCRLLQLWADAVASLLGTPVEPRDAGGLRDRCHQLLNQLSQAELSACSLTELAGQLRCSER